MYSIKVKEIQNIIGVHVISDKLHTKAQSLTDRDKAALQFANEAFYVAFAAGDIKAMEQVWAQDFSVSCIHPGWEPIMGRENVLQSWDSILQNKPHVTHHSPNVFGVGDMGYVICYEQIGKTYLLATNVFLFEDGAWKMSHHQAGPTEGHPPKLTEAPNFSN